MLVHKCDICGTVTEKPLHGLAILEPDEDRGGFSWKSYQGVINLGNQALHGATVMDICEDCRDGVMRSVELGPEDRAIKLDPLPKLWKVAIPGSDDNDDVMDPVLVAHAVICKVGPVLRLSGNTIEGTLYAVYAKEEELWNACVELTRVGVDVAWGLLGAGDVNSGGSK